MMTSAEKMVAVIKESLGDLTVNQIRKSLISSLAEYERLVMEGIDPPGENRGWFKVHDLLACFYGYYGDLDIYWNDYVKSVLRLIGKNDAQLRREINNALDSWLKKQRQINEWKEQGITVIQM